MERLKIKRYWVWLFIAISSVATILILRNIPLGLFVKGMKTIRPLGFIGAICAVVLMWVADAMRIKVLTRATSSHIGMLTALRIVWGGLLFSGITPFEFGGGAYQVIMMHSKGLNSARGTAIITVKALLAMMVLLILAPVVGHLYPGYLSHSAFKYVMLVTCTLMSGTTVVMLVSGIKPSIIIKLGCSILTLTSKAHIIRPGTKDRFETAWSNWAVKCHASFVTIFKKGNGLYMLLAIAFTVVFLLAQFSVAPLMLIGAGVKANVPELILLQVPLTVLLYFIPTPGSSGVAEGGFYAIFALYAPSSLIGILTLMWRFFTFYLGMIMGVISTVPVRAE